MLFRITILSILAFLCTAQTGCNMTPRSQLRAAQHQSRQLYEQAQNAKTERDQLAAQNQRLVQERQSIHQTTAKLQNRLSIADQRLANLQQERAEVQNRYQSLLTSARSKESPLSSNATSRFQALADKYPEFDFDPETGVSKFHSDILFLSGSDQLQVSANPLLREFASILNEGKAKRLNILVVGHTDDKQIRKTNVSRKHETNWHLSTNRANSVVLGLSKLGIEQTRMGAAGYSKFQPVVSNANHQARQRNRRVEIFVLAPDALIAGWDPETSRR